MRAQVLLIDDEKDFSDSIQEFFKAKRVALDRASSWEEGVQMFRTGLHELVIADYNLPGSSHGLQLLAVIKPLRASSELILISGAISSIPESLLKVSGLVNDYIPKTRELPQLLLEKARNAVKRAEEPSNWEEIAKAHIASSEIDKAKLEKIDKLIRRNIDNKGF
jgi:DNA-binding response OmpR family regulator